MYAAYLSKQHPYNGFQTGSLDLMHQDMSISDVLARSKKLANDRAEASQVRDCTVRLGSNAKKALREFQSFVKTNLTDSATGDFYDDMLFEINKTDMQMVCGLLDRQNGNPKGILIKQIVDPKNNDTSIHLFVGATEKNGRLQGSTVCGKKSGEPVYLMGEHAYCPQCLTTPIPQ
jgi:hypothetical protein